MAEKIKLEIVTPQRHLLTEEVDEVIAPGFEGEFGVLPDHTPFLTLLEIGVVRFRQGERERKVAVTGGFAEVLDNRVVILARTAELQDEIDVERAKKALERAEAKLKELSMDDEQYARFEAKLRRAIARLSAAD
ncbi:MAG: F0F1 ATP synthase subunit epsilon [Deltaproteobacteria bacterium]|nr:MAG: F0F1 ATP synthase subunit epsilon [Deltaproteobacteria bacterium]